MKLSKYNRIIRWVALLENESNSAVRRVTLATKQVKTSQSNFYPIGKSLGD